MLRSKIYKGIWYSECTLESFKKIINFDTNVPRVGGSYSNQLKLMYDVFNDKYGKIDLFKHRTLNSTSSKSTSYFIQITTQRWFINCDRNHINTVIKKLQNVTKNPAYFTCENGLDLPYFSNKPITYDIYLKEIIGIGEKYLNNYLPVNLTYKIMKYIT